MDNLTIIYKGASSNTLYTAFFDGATWFGNTKISDQYGGISPESNYNPIPVLFNNRLYLVYKGVHGDSLYSAYYEGNSWFENIEIKKYPTGITPETNYNPGGAVFTGRLYYVYKGEGSNTLYSMDFDGSSWYGNIAIEDQPGGISPDSNYNPGVAVYNNRLYIIYKGSGSNTLYSAWFDGTKWYGNTAIKDQKGGISPESNYNPGVVVYNNRLYIIFKGAKDNILYSAYFDGSIWYGNTAIKDQPGGIDPQSNQSPGVAVFNNKLYVIFKGAKDNVLYTAYYDGSKWAGNTAIKDQPGGITPESNYGPGAAITSNPPK
jgi:hypothetical protein